MSIKRFLAWLVEEVTGRKCRRCVHNRRGRCMHPTGSMFRKCWGSITLPGYQKRPPRFLKSSDDLTAEEQHQLGKIKTALQKAGDVAADAGLLQAADSETGKQYLLSAGSGGGVCALED